MEADTYRTKSGLSVIIYNKESGGLAPWLGAYYSNSREEWIPAKWNSDGTFPTINEGYSSKLDLIIEQEAISA